MLDQAILRTASTVVSSSDRSGIVRDNSDRASNQVLPGDRIILSTATPVVNSEPTAIEPVSNNNITTYAIAAVVFGAVFFIGKKIKSKRAKRKPKS